MTCFAAMAANAGEQKYLYGLLDPQGHLVLKPKFENIDRFISHQGVRVKYRGKWGLVGHSGKFVLKPTYEDLRPVRDSNLIATVKVNGRWGLIGRNGKFVIKPKYDEPFYFRKKSGHARIKLNGKYGIIDRSEQFVIEPRYEQLTRFRKDGLARIKLYGQYGFIDRSGKFVLEPEYEALRRLQKDSTTLFAKRNGRWGLIDLDGKTLIGFKYETIEYCRDNCGATGFARVTLDGKMGIIDRNDNFVIKPQYEMLGHFDKKLNLAMVRVNGKYGFIGPGGKMVIEPKYHMKWPFAFDRTGLARVARIYDGESIDKKTGLVSASFDPAWGLINSKGRFVVKPTYESIRIFNSQPALYEVQLDGKSGIIDRTGKVVLEPKFVYIGTRNSNTGYSMVRVARTKKISPRSYTLMVDGDRVTMVRRGRARVKYGPSKEGLIDNTGKVLLEPVYEKVRVYEKDRILIKQGGKWGLMTLAGEFVIPPKYDRLSGSYSYPGVLEATLHGKHGLIDHQGNNIIEPKYDERVFFFKDTDIAPAKLDGKWGIIDSTGKMVVQPKYEGIEGLAFTQGGKLVPVKLDGRWGLIDMQENMVVAPKYDRIERLNNGYFLTSLSLNSTNSAQHRAIIKRPKITRSKAIVQRPAQRHY